MIHTMTTLQDQTSCSDSPSKDSYIGSYYQPPDRLVPSTVPYDKKAPNLLSKSMDLQIASPRIYQSAPDVDSKAVIDALKILQEKIRRLELERKQAENNVKQFSQAADGYEHHNADHTKKDNTSKISKDKVLASQLQSAEARCHTLEKQLDYMRKMMESAEKDKNAVVEKQALLQKQRLSNGSNFQTQYDKLEKLEKECTKLSRTQTLAEMKITVLEQKLMTEEHERKLVQEKADQLQRELNINLRLCPSAEEVKPKKKAKMASRTPRSGRQSEPVSPSCLRGFKQMPFVAGKSTSPSHSVTANMQSLLHMMKHHQPQLCERARPSLHKPGGRAKKSLRGALSVSASADRPPPGPEETTPSPGCLSELLLALQDELGQMSFEHQELVRQIDATHHQRHRDDLERELEELVKKMEEKGAHITKLRAHQDTVHRLSQNLLDGCDQVKKTGVSRAPFPSPVKEKQLGRRCNTAETNLQLLRETQKFRNSLKQDDLSWET